MRVPEEAICAVCKQIFCCGKCREKHEMKKHAIRIVKKHVEESVSKEDLVEDAYVLCPICSNKPLPLHEFIYAEMLEHIKRHHLPLHCQKCAKVYSNIDDLREFSKCLEEVPISLEVEANKQSLVESSCVLKMTTKSTAQQITISTQTSPHLAATSSLVPISVVNLQWQARTKITQDSSDSAISFKNLSFISNSTSLRHNVDSVIRIETKGKLVRTTSTPLHGETENPKPKEQTFNASAAQVSSIYNSGSDSMHQNSPVRGNAAVGGSNITAQPDAVNLYRKFNGRTKIAAVTPLRHVMSKSIQKAFAEHGLPSFSEQKAFENQDALNSISKAFSASPLDLRLSPALRRSNSDSFGITKTKSAEKVTRDAKEQKSTATPLKKLVFQKSLTASNQVETETFTITRTKELSCYQTPTDQPNSESTKSCSSSSMYKTCQSFEIITSTEASELNTSNDELRAAKTKLSAHVPLTPITRLSGSSFNKKAIKFETPRVANISKCKSSTGEKFYTPRSSLGSSEENISDELDKSAVIQNLSARFSPSCRPSIRYCAQSTAYSHYQIDADDSGSNDEVFSAETEVNVQNERNVQTGGGAAVGIFKTIVDSVLRLPSLKDKSNAITQRRALHAKPSAKTSIIKRCASIAGSLVRSSSLMDEKQLQSLKRKRTNTIDSQFTAYVPIGRTGSMSSLDVGTAEHDIASTKRFRIQCRKPIERMRVTST